MARRDRTDMTPATAANLLVAMTLAILACIALVSYLLLAAPPAQAALLAALTVPAGARERMAHLVARWRLWRLRRTMRETQRQILQFQRLLIEDSVVVQDLAQLLERQDQQRKQLHQQLGLPVPRRWPL